MKGTAFKNVGEVIVGAYMTVAFTSAAIMLPVLVYRVLCGETDNQQFRSKSL